MAYKPTIGLEIHAELKTNSKMFCSCKNDPDEKRPNFNICPVCTAQPGTLPVANEEAIKKLMDNLAGRFEKRAGGYTRIIKTGNRDGDNANTARIELLPAERKEEAPKDEKKKTVSKKVVKKEKKNDK